MILNSRTPPRKDIKCEQNHFNSLLNYNLKGKKKRKKKVVYCPSMGDQPAFQKKNRLGQATLKN